MAIVPEDLTPQKKDALAILLGILLLEHHDKNYLAGDNASRSIAKIELMLKAIEEGRIATLVVVLQQVRMWNCMQNE